MKTLNWWSSLAILYNIVCKLKLCQNPMPLEAFRNVFLGVDVFKIFVLVYKNTVRKL